MGKHRLSAKFQTHTHSCGMPWLTMQICHYPCQLVKLALEYTTAPTLSFMRNSLWHNDFINIWYMLTIAWQQAYRANQRTMATEVIIVFTDLKHVFPRRLLFLVGSLSNKANLEMAKKKFCDIEFTRHWPPLCTGSGCKTPPEHLCFLWLCPGSSAGAAPTCLGELYKAADTIGHPRVCVSSVLAITPLSPHPAYVQYVFPDKNNSS